MTYRETKSKYSWTTDCFRDGKFIGHIDRVVSKGGFYYRFLPSDNGFYGKRTDSINYQSIDEIKLKLENLILTK
jgi:hypothetical protein